MTTISNVGVGDLVDGKYRLIRIIGEGGWGIVFEGENARTLKRVAIKILRARADLTDDIRTRFEREAQAAGRIGSDHIVEVFDLGTLADGSHYMVMELLSGEDLAARLRSTGRMEPTLAAQLVMQLLEGLAAAHEAGIMHRDLKPENLFLVPTRSGEDFVKILDFGISKFTAPGMSSATMTGAILGSPCYMAPEQARGLKNVDPRTDLYSVGTLLFECVTGRVPFDGDNFNDLMFKIALAPRPNPLEFRPDLDAGLVPIIVKAIQADAKDRFESADQFRETLAAWLETQGVESARTPELRRASRTTPRVRVSSPLATTPAPSTFNDKPRWLEATAAVESGASTPLSAASSVDRAITTQKPARKAPVFVAMSAVILLAALAGALALQRARRGTAAPALMGAVSVASTEPPVLPAPTATPLVTLPVPVESSLAASDALSQGAPRSGASPAAALGHSPPRPVTAATHSSASAKAAVVEPGKAPEIANVPPPPPPSPPTPPSPAKTQENLEGRTIQTGL